jgi:hypothetical protein
MFEKYNIPAFFLCKNAVLSAYPSSLTLTTLNILNGLIKFSVWTKPFIIFGEISKYLLTE